MKTVKKGMAMGGMTPASKKPTSTKAPMGSKPAGNPRPMTLGPNDRPIPKKPAVKGKPTIGITPKAEYMSKGGVVKKGMSKGGMAKGGKC